MRKATDITVRRSRLGFCELDLPKNGDIFTISGETFQVTELKTGKKGIMNEAEFMLDTMDGELGLSIRISSVKPFRTEKNG